jgi:hypothetical protein
MAIIDSRLLVKRPLLRGTGRGLVSSGVVGPHAADDDVGQVSLVGAAGFPLGLVLGALAVDVVAGRWMAADLGAVPQVQHRVHLPVAGQVESVVGRRLVALARGHCHRRCPAPAGELGLGGEAGGVADLDQQVHGADGGDAVLLGERGAEPAQQGQDLLVQLGDSRIQAGDVSGRLGQPGDVDPVGGCELGRAGQALLQRTESRTHPAGLWQRRPHG